MRSGIAGHGDALKGVRFATYYTLSTLPHTKLIDRDASGPGDRVMSIDRDLLRLMVYHVQVESRFALYRFLDAETLSLLNQLHPWLLMPGEEPEEGYEDPFKRLNHYNERSMRTHLAVHDFLTHAANVAKIFFPDTRMGTPERCRARE